MKRQTALEIICALLVLLFLYTGLSKFLNFHTFKSDMHNQPFPGWMAQIIIYTLPSLECILATLLCFEKTRNAGLWGSLIVMLLFTFYTALVLFRFFPRVPCGCGGIIRSLTWTQHLLVNILFTTLSATGLLLNKKHPDG